MFFTRNINSDFFFVFQYYSGVGSKVGLTYRILQGHKVVGGAQALVPIERDGSVIVPVRFRPEKGVRYTLTVSGTDEHGHVLAASRRLVAAR